MKNFSNTTFLLADTSGLDLMLRNLGHGRRAEIYPARQSEAHVEVVELWR